MKCHLNQVFTANRATNQNKEPWEQVVSSLHLLVQDEAQHGRELVAHSRLALLFDKLFDMDSARSPSSCFRIDVAWTAAESIGGVSGTRDAERSNDHFCQRIFCDEHIVMSRVTPTTVTC